MKSNVKYMLLGIAVMLLSIYIGIVFIGYLGLIIMIIGFLVVLFGFLSPDHHEDITDKEKSIKTVACPKCGKEHKEVYTSCPWCGYKEK